MDKRERLDAVLERRELESVWFCRPNSFAWLTGGSNVVDRSADLGVAAVGYDGDQYRVVTDTIEAERIAAEELPDLDDPSVASFPWYESSLPEALTDVVSGPAAADVPVPGFERLDPSELRQPLTQRDRSRYRELGQETAAAVESVCHELEPADTEHEVAAAVSVALDARGIESPVVLVGGSERAQHYRHYTPTMETLGRYALVSVTARRQGLHASCTRTVAFDPPSWLEERHASATLVENTALAATQDAGTTDASAGDVFAAIQHAYADLGYPDEWQRHHQGGAAGFAGREWIATPDDQTAIVTPMAYAWNPTIAGAKSEDTVLVTDDDFEILTATDDWPTKTVGAVEYDQKLERASILGLDK